MARKLAEPPRRWLRRSSGLRNAARHPSLHRPLDVTGPDSKVCHEYGHVVGCCVYRKGRMFRTAETGEGYDRTVIEPHDPLIGTVLDQRFRIEHQLAAGGFGAIYRATDVRSDAQVALKVLLPRITRDPMVVARFRREGTTLASLRDPLTSTAYELGEAPDGTLYIV